MSGLAGCVMDPRLGLSPDCAAVILAAGDGVRPCAGSRRKTENDRGRVAGQTGERGKDLVQNSVALPVHWL
jgi:hypothetical protein